MSALQAVSWLFQIEVYANLYFFKKIVYGCFPIFFTLSLKSRFWMLPGEVSGRQLHIYLYYIMQMLGGASPFPDSASTAKALIHYL